MHILKRWAVNTHCQATFKCDDCNKHYLQITMVGSFMSANMHHFCSECGKRMPLKKMLKWDGDKWK